MISAPKIWFDILRRVERKAARLQGKGFGAFSIAAEVQAACALLPRRPEVAIDIGGNVGHYAAALRARFPALEIHVFEPASVNVAALRERFTNDPAIRVNPLAVGRDAASATLFSDKPGSGLGSLTKRNLDHLNIPFDASEGVQVIRFDAYWRDVLHERPIDLVKLDIEGHELDALAGMGAALAATQAVQFEFGGANIDTRTYLRDFFALFADAGFDIHRITPAGVQRLASYRESDECFTTTNFIAPRRS
jgi:FkbM family methyltransferase